MPPNSYLPWWQKKKKTLYLSGKAIPASFGPIDSRLNIHLIQSSNPRAELSFFFFLRMSFSILLLSRWFLGRSYITLLGVGGAGRKDLRAVIFSTKWSDSSCAWRCFWFHMVLWAPAWCPSVPVSDSSWKSLLLLGLELSEHSHLPEAGRNITSLPCSFHAGGQGKLRGLDLPSLFLNPPSSSF